MSIHVAIHHVSHYRYDRPIQLGAQTIRLRPCPHTRNRIVSYRLRITPEAHFINWQQDPQSNWLARLVFPAPTREFCVEVDLVTEWSVINPFDFFLEPHAEQIPFQYEDWQRRELAPFLVRQIAPSACGPLFHALLDTLPRQAMPSVEFLVALNQCVHDHVGYTIRMEPGVQDPEWTLLVQSGSCRDSAWLLVQVLRHLGLAARFVSGYLVQLTADQPSLDGPSGPSADFTDLHAWCEVYLPGAGWVGLDPTSGLFAGEGHIPLACTPEPASAAPISGTIEACHTEFQHQMQVHRILETPRVTKPYAPQQWQAMLSLGDQVDQDLQAMDVRLTMGGEPTFVALDDPDGAAWNTSASSPGKRLLAAALFRRLQEHYAPQGLTHIGQGKWYPGEPLPRWSFNCFWRRDGEAIWHQPELLAREGAQHGADGAQAQALLQHIAAGLGLSPDHVFPAYEDVGYYLWREGRLPCNVTPDDARLADPLERARLRRVFEQGLGAARGYVLPVLKGEHGAWRSGRWFLRGGHCLLVPGDSPLGYRLPLASQPWVAQHDVAPLNPPDPAQERPALPPAASLRPGAASPSTHHAPSSTLKPASRQTGHHRPMGSEPAQARHSAPLPGESAADLVRVAMCVEPRDGALHVFMPPTEQLEHYLELVAAVEAAAAALQLAVVLEGYEPPLDPRLIHFRVTPDPGVIEVNIHPAASWRELVERTTQVYDMARHTRLGTEKFMIDGRHTGTGGGNHLVLGAAAPTDSPFLRRPDLLASLVAYWQNHPSLSFLFSGLFIGPTSQAPRLDEARNDSLHELEIALRQIPAPGQTVPPWLIDRLLRHLLVDVTGNTHRAEFCIDKLFSPDGPTGRMGLVELRAFEMPPHAEMSLAQQLLLRALVARFWKTPYRPARLTRWGTELHDRFMLPHFVAQDFREVIDELQQAGYPLRHEWFAPHVEFRFPKVGDLAVGGMLLELRHALEPWHVLGEENSAGGTVRYVDSSVERLQVLVRGLVPERYALSCNQVLVPLHPTGTQGEYVAGIRYRAWQPPSGLHPTIRSHSPLIFDLVDSGAQRSLAGCQYHVTHPGGRSFDTRPVNALEAESRRLARFFRMGHTPGPLSLQTAPPSPEYPFTLDLRRAAPPENTPRHHDGKPPA